MVVRMRHTRAHTANRRSHHSLTAPELGLCANCGAHHRPHHMCQDCGFYKGRMVIDMAAKKDARTARMQAKKDAIKGQQSAEESEATSEGMLEQDSNVTPDRVAAGKTKVLAAPETAKAKRNTPRKEQGA